MGHRGIDEAWERLCDTSGGRSMVVQERQTCEWVTADLWHSNSWKVTVGGRFTDVSVLRATSSSTAKREREYVM